MYSFSYLEPVCCSMSSSNYFFLICIQISQEAGQVFWYSHLLKNFPEFVVVQIVKGFGIVNKAEVDVFMELSCFLDDAILSCPTLVIPWTVACHAPLSMGFSKQENWSVLPFSSPGDLPDQELNPCLLHCREILYQLNYKGSPV